MTLFLNKGVSDLYEFSISAQSSELNKRTLCMYMWLWPKKATYITENMGAYYCTTEDVN